MQANGEWGSLPRAALLGLAAILLGHCSVLLFVYRAVPSGECGRAALAVVVALLWTKGGAWSSGGGKVRRLAVGAGMRLWVLRLWLAVAGMVSLILPWVLVLRGGSAAADVLGPHLFVFATQVLFEIWSNRTQVSISLRLSIPVAFAAYRLRVIFDWIGQAQRRPVERAVLVLGFVNAAFWATVLFYVLLMRVAPPYFSPGRQEPPALRGSAAAEEAGAQSATAD